MFLTCKSLLLVILHLLAPSAVFSDAISANFSVSQIFTLYFIFFIILYEIRAFAILSNNFRFILFCLKIAVIGNFKIPCHTVHNNLKIYILLIRLKLNATFP